MSSILKALEQLERDRARKGPESRPPVEPEARRRPPRTRRRRQRRIRRVGAAIALVVAVAAGFLWGAALDRGGRGGTDPAEPLDASSAAPARRPAAAAPTRSEPEQAEPGPAPALPEAHPSREHVVAAPGRTPAARPAADAGLERRGASAGETAAKVAGPPGVLPASAPLEPRAEGSAPVSPPLQEVADGPGEATSRPRERTAAHPAPNRAVKPTVDRARTRGSLTPGRSGELARTGPASGALDVAPAATSRVVEAVVPAAPAVAPERQQPLAAPAPGGLENPAAGPTPDSVAPPASAASDRAEPVAVETPLPGLESTRWHPAPERRQAQLLVAGTRQWVGQADRVSGFEVLEITPSSVVLERGDEVFQVRVGAR